jgi:DnaJ-class molecular chaperone
MKTKYCVCPECDGDGEAVGAPLDLEGVWLCNICNGTGEVTQEQAKEYEKGLDSNS